MEARLLSRQALTVLICICYGAYGAIFYKLLSYAYYTLQEGGSPPTKGGQYYTR